MGGINGSKVARKSPQKSGILDLNSVLDKLDSGVINSGRKSANMCDTHLHGQASIFSILHSLESGFCKSLCWKVVTIESRKDALPFFFRDVLSSFVGPVSAFVPGCDMCASCLERLCSLIVATELQKTG